MLLWPCGKAGFVSRPRGQTQGRRGGFPWAPEITAWLALTIRAFRSLRPWSFFIWNKFP